jgi:hypothetical protein
MAFATGKFSFGLCDYCGQRYPYNVLRTNWRGFKVCPDDYEPKEPQLDPLKYNGDAIALLQPRPDRVEPLSVYLGAPGDSSFESIGGANTLNGSVSSPTNMMPERVQPALVGRMGQGNLTVVVT